MIFHLAPLHLALPYLGLLWGGLYCSYSLCQINCTYPEPQPPYPYFWLQLFISFFLQALNSVYFPIFGTYDMRWLLGSLELLHAVLPAWP